MISNRVKLTPGASSWPFGPNDLARIRHEKKSYHKNGEIIPDQIIDRIEITLADFELIIFSSNLSKFNIRISFSFRKGYPKVNEIFRTFSLKCLFLSFPLTEIESDPSPRDDSDGLTIKSPSIAFRSSFSAMSRVSI